MRRCLGLVALVSVGALLLGACDASLSPYAARVNGTTISPAALHSELDGFASDPGLVCEFATRSQGAVAVSGAGAGNYDATFSAAQLSSLIDNELVTEALAKLHLAVPASATALAREELVDNVLAPPANSPCGVNGDGVFAALPTTVRSSLVASQANTDVLAAHLAGGSLSPVGIAAYGKSHAVTAADQCISVIVVSSAQKAAQLRAEIENGASFALVAEKNSIDSSTASSGGTFGCYLLGGFYSSFANAIARLKIGEVSPVLANSADNYLLLEVTSRPAPTLGYGEALVENGSAAENTYVNGLAARSQVDVDASEGIWSDVGGSFEVKPRTGPAVALLPNSAAITPATAAASNG